MIRLVWLVLGGVALIQPAVAQPGGYAVVVSKRTLAQEEWKAVVHALTERHGAEVIPFEGAVTMARAGLTARMPGRTAFVLRPEEAGRQAVLDIHRMTRALDDDPYTDTLWGIVTGYDGAAALRLMAPEDPLLVKRGAAGCSMDLGVFESGSWYSEMDPGVWSRKVSGGEPEPMRGPQDSVPALAKAFAGSDLILTSGHATERDWRPGYRYQNGQFRCQDGVLVGVDMAGRAHPVRSAGPKVYLAAGNCLMGHVDGHDAMALAFMNSAGVRQLVGYTVVTWHGAGGWGTRDWFFNEPGRRSFADSWFANNQRITWRLKSEFPATMSISVDDWEDVDGAVAKVKDIREVDPDGRSLRENTGLIWDWNTVAFFGDPAFDCRLESRDEPWVQRLEREGDLWTLTIEGKPAADVEGRVFQWLPHRIDGIEVVEGAELNPVVTDNFVMVPGLDLINVGERRVIRFKGARSGEDAVDGLRLEGPPGHVGSAAAPRTRAELLKLADRCPPEQAEGMRRLVAAMPESDIGSVNEEFLLRNVDYAYRARAAVPWGRSIPDEVFYDHVLPYASVNERRDPWRKEFYERFIEEAKQCASPAEAMARLNVLAFKTFNVSYHPSKRPKPDQSPYESIAANYASCTGLSIMLVDACRAVCVPARFAGTARWTTVRGNHSWVEVFDREWLVIGACEPGEPGKTWFMGRAAEADASDPLKRIYAVDWGAGDTHFPLVWKRESREARACDVTPFYTRRQRTRVVVHGTTTSRPQQVTLRHGGRIVAHAPLQEGAVTVTLARGETYDAEVRCADEAAARRFKVTLDGDELVIKL